MPLARVGNTLLYHVHIPKTGGTSIERYLRTKGPLGLSGERLGWSRTTPQHIDRDIHETLLPPGLYDHAFAVIRNPKARLFSEFRMRAEPFRPKLRPAGWARLARYRARGRRAYGLRIRRRIEYYDFDDWVGRVFAEYRADPFYKDNHIPPAGAVRLARHPALPLRGGARAGLSLDRHGHRHAREPRRVPRAPVHRPRLHLFRRNRGPHPRLLPRGLRAPRRDGRGGGLSGVPYPSCQRPKIAPEGSRGRSGRIPWG